MYGRLRWTFDSHTPDVMSEPTRVKVVSINKRGRLVEKDVEAAGSDTLREVFEKAYPEQDHARVYATVGTDARIPVRNGGECLVHTEDGGMVKYTIKKAAHGTSKVDLFVTPDILEAASDEGYGSLSVLLGENVLATFVVRAETVAMPVAK